MLYIVGLGNPGEKYIDTRHNVGRRWLEQFAATQGVSWQTSRPAQALYAHTVIAGTAVDVVLPETYMNRSGDTVQFYVEKDGAAPADFIVLHDDVDLALGEIKVSQGRGDGGNNGIKSIIARLGSKDFTRVRIGIAPRHWWTGQVQRPRSGGPLEKFVLQRFSRQETTQLAELQPRITEVITDIVTQGPQAAMNRHN